MHMAQGAQVPTIEELFLQIQPTPGRQSWPEHGVELIHVPADGRLESSWEQPAIVCVITGRKVGVLGARPFEVASGQLLVVHLPMLSSCASSDLSGAPFLAVSWNLHVETVIDLLRAVRAQPVVAETPGVADKVPVADLGELGRSTVYRQLLSLQDPTTMQVMMAGLRREIHFQALNSACGSTLHALLDRDGRAGAIWRSALRMRDNLAEPMTVAQLARASAMSKSLYFALFRRHTGCSPLQYQKRLRLERALELLGRPGMSVSTVANAVGYKSASQFSREFRRAHGFPPSQAVTVPSNRDPTG